MKLQDIFESEELWRKEAKKMGYKLSSGTEKHGGKPYDVILLIKQKDVFDVPIQFKYIINPETKTWSFKAKTEKAEIEVASGEDFSTLEKHIPKKSKLSKHNFEKYLK